ncbi:MAG: sulfatase-like hydrolase/transferase [Gemmatimonadota bacterium]
MSWSGWSRRVSVVFAAVAIVLVAWIIPRVIAAAYDGESIGILNRIITGQDTHPVGFYLAAWWRLVLFAGLVTVGLIVVQMVAGGRFGSRLAAVFVGRPDWSASRVLGMAMWFGAISGVAQSALATSVYLIGRDASLEFQWESIWMAPIAGALAMLLASGAMLLFLWPFQGTRGSRYSVRSVVFVLGGLATTGALYQALPFIGWSLGLVSLGAATMMARHAAGHPGGWGRLPHRSRLVLPSLLLIGAGVGVAYLPGPLEARRLRSLGAAQPEAPNVVLIILDTVRSSSMSLYGHDRPTTPNLEARAENAVVFDNAISPAAWTLPSHASLFTGRWPHELSTDLGVPLDGTYATLAEVLADRGYHTAGFTANYYNTTEASGLARGFARYEDFPVTWGRFFVSSWLSRTLALSLPLAPPSWRLWEKRAKENTDDVVGWLTALDEDRPFFLFVNYIDAHGPYEPPYRFRFPSDKEAVSLYDVWDETVSEEQLAGNAALYDGEIAYLDDELERLFDALEARGYGDNTLVVITSDHGEFHGEHGLMGHGDGLYEPSVRVPLLIFDPMKRAGRVTVDAPVSLRDVAATITDVAFGTPDPRLGGESLRRLWSDREHDTGWGNSPVLTETIGGRVNSPFPGRSHHEVAVFQGTNQYVRNEGGREELYDLAVDPRQLHDLSEDTAFAPTLRRLAALADSLVRVAVPAPDLR